MNVQTQFIQMAHSSYMQQFAERKLKKLFVKYDWIIRIDVTFKMENESTGNGKICTMEVSLPGPKVFAMSNKDSYELAINETINDLCVQLKKRKAIMVERR